MSSLKGANTGFAKGEALHLLRPNSSRSTFYKKKRTEFQICLKNREYLERGFEKRISGVIFCGRDWFLKKKKILRTHENITFCSTISSCFVKPQKHTDGEVKP